MHSYVVTVALSDAAVAEHDLEQSDALEADLKDQT